MKSSSRWTLCANFCYNLYGINKGKLKIFKSDATDGSRLFRNEKFAPCYYLLPAFIFYREGSECKEGNFLQNEIAYSFNVEIDPANVDKIAEIECRVVSQNPPMDALYQNLEKALEKATEYKTVAP